MHNDELISRVQNGEKDALNAIVIAYYDEIYRFLCRKLSNNIDAQDVAQIVFVKLINSIRKLDEEYRKRY